MFVLKFIGAVSVCSIFLVMFCIGVGWTIGNGGPIIAALLNKFLYKLSTMRNKRTTTARTGDWWVGATNEWLNEGPYPSKLKAIEAGQDRWGCFYIGRAGEYTPFDWDLMETLTEQEMCALGDACGPGASDLWPDRVSKEDRERANQVIRGLMYDLYGDCPVFPIEDLEFISGDAA